MKSNKNSTYINFIGIDGSGKDTIYNKVIQNYPNAIQHREPGGSPESEIIRKILLNPTDSLHKRLALINDLLLNPNVTPLCKEYLTNAKGIMNLNGLTGKAEIYLFAASRAQTNETLVKPVIEKGHSVFGRRSIACSMSYQGFARNLGMKTVWEINKEAISSTLPTLEILFDLPASVALDRLTGRTEKQDRLDSEPLEFYQKCREGYLRYYQEYCPYDYVIIDATQPIEDVFNETMRILKLRLN